jgi:hypothetical protein
MPGIDGYFNVSTEILSPFAVVTNPAATQTVNQPLGVALDFYDTAAGKMTFSIANGGSVSGTPGFSVMSGFTIDSAANDLQIAGYQVLISGLAIGDILEFNGANWVNSSTASAGVTSLNGLSGALTLVEGAGITITPSGHNITLVAAAGNSPQVVLTVVDMTMTDPGGTVFTYTPPLTVGMYRVSWTYVFNGIDSTLQYIHYHVNYQDSQGNNPTLTDDGHNRSANLTDIVNEGFIDFRTDDSGTDIVLSVDITMAQGGSAPGGPMSATLERLF